MNISFDQMLMFATALLAPIGSYYGAIAAVKIELARLETRLSQLEKAFDSDHTKLDELRKHSWSRHDE